MRYELIDRRTGKAYVDDEGCPIIVTPKDKPLVMQMAKEMSIGDNHKRFFVRRRED